jgi:glycosyltransferase-like protein
MATPRVALVTYSVKPRGGAVHTLSLAEALHRLGVEVTVMALGDPEQGFFRPVDAPWSIVGPAADGSTLEEKVFRSVHNLSAGLSSVAGRFDLIHTQDCISARAAVRVRDGSGSGRGIPVLRTVHHVDDFTTPALIDCQRQAILEPDRILVVSQFWRKLLVDEYGVNAQVVHNGADGRRFPPLEPERRAARRRTVGVDDDRFLFLAVGGIEPRKGSVHLMGALGQLKGLVRPSPVLAVVGGHSFQDYAAYRDATLAGLGALGLDLGRDVVLLGTVPDEELAEWYLAADALVFPSLKEGWGLAVLEAMGAGLPVIATDIPVFREYLTDQRDALLVPPADPNRLAEAMQTLMADDALRSTLVEGGRQVAARFTWEATARRHAEIYQSLALVEPYPSR